MLLQIAPLIFLLQAEGFAWSQLIQFGPTVVILALLLFAAIRLAPVYKEIKVKELDLRAEENVVKGQQAVALGELANALRDIAVEQRRATEEVGILQRVNADTSDQLSHTVKALSQRVDVMQQRIEIPSSLQDSSEKR